MREFAECFRHGKFDANLRRCPQCRVERLERENAKLHEALAVYADARHWAIRRNGKAFEDCIWIGPGATDTVPDGPKTAREALA